MGSLLIWLALAASLISAVAYFGAYKAGYRFAGKKKNQDKILKDKLSLARRAYLAMTVLVTLASAYLVYLIFSHQFQFDYVYRYSARDMSPGLLLSTFWAGQAGSFLLWALFIAVMGVALMRTARMYESLSMMFLSVVQAFFLLLLVKASPFIQNAHAPADGTGLNPLLQNFWMIIHPPILFLGYAAAAIPLVLALSALVLKDYEGWTTLVMPWTLFTSITLGAGIIIGGYWAYGTLGWGGYWGWDPVENSSLVPWMVNFALFHGLIIQKVRGGLRRTNLLLAVLSFVLVIYATFLTRSGVLADFSVHSFQDLGINAFLILFLLTPLVFGLGLFAKRSRTIPTTPIETSTINRENTLFVSMLILLASALVILLGTSFPIISRLFTEPSNVNISFYNEVNLPLAIALTLILGVTPVLRWGTQQNGYLRKLLISLGLTAISVAIALFAGLEAIGLILFTATSAFALWTNVIVGTTNLRISWLNTGAPLAHAGLAIMFIGIIVSGYFDRDQYTQLTLGVPTQVLGHTMTFEGTERPHDGKDRLHIRVQKGGTEYVATPRFYFTNYNNSMMKEPFIRNGWLQDIYFSPIERIRQPRASDPTTLTLHKGETKDLRDYKIRFTGFDMHTHGDDGAVKIGATLEIAHGTQTFSLTPALTVAGNNRQTEPVVFPLQATNGHAPSVMLRNINANDKSIQLAFAGFEDLQAHNDPPQEQIAIQVSSKPFMNVLWLGTVLITLGTVVALKRRLMLQQQISK